MNEDWYNIEIHIEEIGVSHTRNISRLRTVVDKGLLDDFTGDKCYITDITNVDPYRACFYMESTKPVDTINMVTLLSRIEGVVDLARIKIGVDCFNTVKKHFTGYYWKGGSAEARHLPPDLVEDIESLCAEDRNERIQEYVDATKERTPEVFSYKDTPQTKMNNFSELSGASNIDTEGLERCAVIDNRRKNEA